MKSHTQTGRVNVYISFAAGHYSKLRPSHDSAADAIGELTEVEVNTLRGMIHRYIDGCHKRHGKALLDAAMHRESEC